MYLCLRSSKEASMAGEEWEGQRTIKIRSGEVGHTMQSLRGWRTSAPLMAIMASVQTLKT